LISGLLAAINQLIRLAVWHREESQKDTDKELVEELEALEARVDAIDGEIERLEAERELQK
jgi:hypothetical protein